MVPKNRSHDAAWEERCRRCGRCCFEKVEFEGEVFTTETPCEKLDLATGLCTVYERRFRARPGCVPLTPERIAMGLLPGDCPYVAGVQGYRAPRSWEEA